MDEVDKKIGRRNSFLFQFLQATNRLFFNLSKKIFDGDFAMYQ